MNSFNRPACLPQSQDFIRVFLDDENVKTISMNPPFSVANLIDELRKKMYLVDTEGFVIHEVRSTGGEYSPLRSAFLVHLNSLYSFTFGSEGRLCVCVCGLPLED